MENISVLRHTVEHLTGDEYADAYFIPFKGSDNILPIGMTALGIDIDSHVLTFRLNIENCLDRSILSNNKTWPIFSESLYNVVCQFDHPYKSFKVKILDKKGKEASCNYFAMQINKMQGLINKQESVFEENEILPEVFEKIEKLVFHNLDKIPQLFRIDERPNLLFLREKLMKKIKENNFPGITITNINEFDWD